MPRTTDFGILEILHKDGAITFVNGEPFITIVANAAEGEGTENALVSVTDFVGLTKHSIVRFAKANDKLAKASSDAERLIDKLIEAGMTPEDIAELLNRKAAVQENPSDNPATEPETEPATEPAKEPATKPAKEPAAK